MGLYDDIIVEKDVELPYFPDELDQTEVGWQTKSLDRTLSTYKITEDGRLMRKEQSFREKTEEEKNEMAREYTDGEAQTWDEWEEQNSDDGWDFPLVTWERTVDEEWWVDHNMHGTLTFYSSVGHVEGLDVFFEYEARFSKGDLDEIVFLGNRSRRNDGDAVEEAKELIEKWRQSDAYKEQYED